MSFSEIPPPPEVDPGNDEPAIRVKPPGPESSSWLTRAARVGAPMGPAPSPTGSQLVRTDVPASSIVYSTGKGSNVIDVDGNRYVDLAAGFGALLLGHSHPRILKVLELQAPRLMQALGDVYPSQPKIALSDRLAALYPEPGARVILGQSGADAVSAALKTAMLFTGKPGIVAFSGSYHGLSYGPLAATGLRAGYREPFLPQLNPVVRFVDYPSTESEGDAALERVRFELARGRLGAVLIEPVLGRGGCVVPPPGFLAELSGIARAGGALLIADEIWSGLGRAGELLYSVAAGARPDVICLGKGLGGGLPISACIGSANVMQAWRREPEVVHTSTFAGAPLACCAAIATLDVISREQLVERSAHVGTQWLAKLRAALEGLPGVDGVRGAGMMVGIDVQSRAGGAPRLMRALLERGYIVSSGGGSREVVVLTPPLNIAETLLDSAACAIREAIHG